MADAFSGVLVQVAEDLKQAGKLNANEVISVKRVINLLNGAVQTLASDKFDRVINALQGITSVVVDQTDNAQITGKVVGDGIKKYNLDSSLKCNFEIDD